jgi:hypothetical protein
MDAQQIMNAAEWKILAKMLGFSSDQLADLAEKLANAANADPSQKQAWVAFSGKICGYDVENGRVGIQVDQGGPSLFVDGKLTITILGQTCPEVTFLAVLSSGGAVISGKIDKSLEVPVINLTLTDPLLVISVDPDGIPTPGIGGDIDLGSSLETSFLMLIIGGKDGAENTVFVASVSELSAKTIFESIAHLTVPDAVASLLDIVKLTHFKDEEFSIDAGLAADLDAEQLAAVSLAFKDKGKVDLPATLDQAVLVVRAPGEKWSITNLQDDKHRHYQLAKGDSGIEVTVDPQVYYVPSDTEFAGDTFKQGCFVKGRVDILGLGGQATVGMNPVEIDADLDKIVIADERLFSIASATDSGKGPHLSYVMLPSTTDPNNPQWPSLSDPHFDLDAKVTLLGLSANANVKISTQQLTCAFSMGGDGIEVSGSASFPSPSVSANVSIDAGSVSIPLVGGIDIGKISAGLTITADGARFDDFNFNVLGVGFTIPGTSISIPVGSTLTGLANQLKDEAIDKVKDYFGDYLDPAKLAGEAADYLKGIGDDIGKIVSGQKSLPTGVPSPPDPKNSTSLEVRDWIWNFHRLFGGEAIDFVKLLAGAGFSPPQIIWPLKQNIFAAGDIAAAIATVYRLDHPGIVGIWLAQAGFDIDTVADCLRSNLNLGRDDAVSVLGNAGYTVTTRWPVEGTAYFMAAAAGLSNPASRLLYATADNTVRFNDKDDGSGRPLWRFTKLSDGTYSISPVAGPARYLSCQEAGDNRGSVVNLWPTADGSGHQRWMLTPTGDGSFTIQTQGAVKNPQSNYLSCSSDGTVFDLWNTDDGSGRQEWRLLPWPATDYTNYVIQNRGSQSAAIYLSTDVTAHSSPDNYFEHIHLSPSRDVGQIWRFERVAEGVFHIRPEWGLLAYLSCSWESGHGDDGSSVDLWHLDDNSGRQQWTLTPIGDGTFTITIETPGALKNPEYKYLSCNWDGSAIDLYHTDDGSGRQRWTVIEIART